jgi:hypothetical protein
VPPQQAPEAQVAAGQMVPPQPAAPTAAGGGAAPPAQATPAAGQQPTPIGQVAMPMSRASAIVKAMTQPRMADGPPPWQGPQQALSQRLIDWQANKADRYTSDMLQRTETSAKAVVKALQSLETGPGANIMRKIGTEAAADPNGAAGVIEQMRPGGRHEALRNEYNTEHMKNPAFAKAVGAVRDAFGNYLLDRDALAVDFRRRGWNPADIDKRMESTDRAIAQGVERVPGRESGKSLTEELAETARKLAHDLIEKVKQVFSHVGPHQPPAPGQSQSPGISASP